MATILDTGPCTNWVAICDDFPPEDTRTAEQQLLIDQSVQAATEALWNRTKRRFGLCEKTFRPCRRECWPAWQWLPPAWHNATNWGWPFPALVGGTWINMACGSCGDSCSCSTAPEVVLPYPVADIIEVKIDGDVLDPEAYRVDDHRLLVRVDGGEWPRCNDLDKDDTQPGTWSVTAAYGEMVPTLGQFAVGQLAGQFYKACTGDKGCVLPASLVTQITRQGVTKTLANAVFKRGKIGLYYPDLFIDTYNPSGTGVATIYDIDGPRRRNAGSLPGPTPAAP